MSQQEITQLKLIQLQDLHIATCSLMTRFINGHHCPKLSHLIVHHLEKLHSFSTSISTQIATNQEMYLQLLDHWQKVTYRLLEQQAAKKATINYH